MVQNPRIFPLHTQRLSFMSMPNQQLLLENSVRNITLSLVSVVSPCPTSDMCPDYHSHETLNPTLFFQYTSLTPSAGFIGLVISMFVRSETLVSVASYSIHRILYIHYNLSCMAIKIIVSSPQGHSFLKADIPPLKWNLWESKLTCQKMCKLINLSANDPTLTSKDRL